MLRHRITAYTDYKSPYAYVASQATFELAARPDVDLEWLPYTLDIPSYLGTVEERDPHQGRKVRYGYMDARRLAERQGLVLKGPRRIYSAYLSSVGLLYAKRCGLFAGYHREVFRRFWNRELDIDSPTEMSALISELGGDGEAFAAYAQGTGREEHDRIRAEAEDAGVFGVPTFVLDGELFFGGDRLPLLHQVLDERLIRAR